MAKKTLTKYSVGDKVVYPMHGVGQVELIEEKKILDMQQMYYIIRIACDDMTVMIPVDKCDALGLRPIVSDTEVKRALRMLMEKSEGMNDDWKVRFNDNKEKIKTGSIFKVSEVVRNLYQRNRKKELSSSEKKLYENAYQLLVDEISLKMDKEPVYVENMISEKLEEGQRRIDKKAAAEAE